MHYALLFSILAVISANTCAQNAPASATSVTKNSRDAVIRSALARDHGEITAMEAARMDGGGIYIGYSSGAVAHCRDEGGCITLDGTPSGAISGAALNIRVSRSGGAEVAWVAYPHGVLYRCGGDLCSEFDHD
tara:strand:+ start:11562 stop:11960 length:399 start_codon:yes stop_codon:yes gene_type:complete